MSGFNSQFIDSLGSSRKMFEIPEGVELAAEDHDPLAVDVKRFLIPSDLPFISYQPPVANKRSHTTSCNSLRLTGSG